MNNFILSCCTTTDVTQEFLSSRKINYAPFHYFLNDVEYIDDFGKTISILDFYKRMAEGEIARTSQINVQEFYNYFKAFLKEGKDVLHVTLSSGLSGTYNSACIARDMLLEKYPERKIFIVDSLGASSGYGLYVGMIADKKNAGSSIEETFEYAEKIKSRIRHWFFTTDLKYFVRGGRISKTAGFVGNLIRLCPLLAVDEAGKLVVREKIISKKKVIKAIVDKMILEAENGTEYDKDCYISHSACIEDAEEVKKLIEFNFPKLKDKIKIFDIGTTIGAHTGPGTVALFFFGK